MTVKISQPNRSANNSAIEEFESAIGTRLPDDYRLFLLSSNGGEPEPNEARVLPPVNTIGVRLFFGILGEPEHGDLRRNRDRMIQRVPLDMLPIAEDDCGNLICLSLGEADFGGLFFWDHELEADEGEPATFSNLFKISNSFHELMESLETPAPVVLKEGQVKRVWIDPDFLASLNKKE